MPNKPDSRLQAITQSFIRKQQLPDSYLAIVETWFLPLANSLKRKHEELKGPLVVGISGCQGSGKSTLAALLAEIFRHSWSLRAVNLSLDDFYLTHQQRQTLAAEVHPLLATRGVPGTHDVELACSTLSDLKESGSVVNICRFDKATDDRKPQHEWTQVQVPVDIIILEGWCLNIPSQEESELQTPINDLERDEDPGGIWRNYVNLSLAEHYPALFSQVNHLVNLKAPGFDSVYLWRRKQEQKLIQERGIDKTDRMMDDQQLDRFIQHFERLTRHGLERLPKFADTIFVLDQEQNVIGIQAGPT